MGSIDFETHVHFRDPAGRFISKLEMGTVGAVQELGSEGAEVARALAPHRSGFLASRIEWVGRGFSGTMRVLGVPYAEPQEYGAGPHPIGAPGQMLGDAGDDFSARGPVMHPGNPATHFFRQAVAAINAAAPSTFDRHLP